MRTQYLRYFIKPVRQVELRQFCQGSRLMARDIIYDLRGRGLVEVLPGSRWRMTRGGWEALGRYLGIDFGAGTGRYQGVSLISLQGAVSQALGSVK